MHIKSCGKILALNAVFKPLRDLLSQPRAGLKTDLVALRLEGVCADGIPTFKYYFRALSPLRRNGNGLLDIRVFSHVGEYVVEYSHKALGLGRDHSPHRKLIKLVIDLDVVAVFRKEHNVLGEHLLKEHTDVVGLEHNIVKGVAKGKRIFEHIVRERFEPQRRTLRGFDIFLQHRLTVRLALHHLKIAEKYGKRCPYIVGHCRYQLGVCVAGFPLPVKVFEYSLTHIFYVGRKPAYLIRALRCDLMLHTAVSYDGNLSLKPSYSLNDTAEIIDNNKRQRNEGKHHTQNIHNVVLHIFRVIVNRGIKGAFSKLQLDSRARRGVSSQGRVGRVIHRQARVDNGVA